MNLYEITNGYTGYAYTRCYVWAESEAQALEIATEMFKENAKDKYRPKPARYWKNLECELLLSKDSASFVTKISDVGWET